MKKFLLLLTLIFVQTILAMTWTVLRMTNSQAENITTSLSLDRDGKVHIAYDEGTLGYKDLHYLTNQSGTWVDTILTSNPNDEWIPSIAVDQNGKVHIAYIAGAEEYLWYATNLSGYWEISQIPTGTGNGFVPSLAVDDRGMAHIAYQIGIGAGIDYVTNCSGDWVVEWSTTPGFTPALCLDGQGNVHIAYEKNDQLYYASDETGNWVETFVTSGGDRNFRPSIKCDQNNKSHIAFVNHATPIDILCCYATDVNGSWVTVQIDSSMTWLTDPSLSIDAMGSPHIIYTHSPGPAEIYYANYRNNIWSKSPITNNGYVDGILHTGVFEIDHDGYGHATFYGIPETNYEIYYARSDSAICSIDEMAATTQKSTNILISPNPFRNFVKFQINDANNKRLQIYDAAGRVVKIFGDIRRNLDNSGQSVFWDGTDDSGHRVPAGIYFVQLGGGDYKPTEKVVLLR